MIGCGRNPHMLITPSAPLRTGRIAVFKNISIASVELLPTFPVYFRAIY